MTWKPTHRAKGSRYDLLPGTLLMKSPVVEGYYYREEGYPDRPESLYSWEVKTISPAEALITEFDQCAQAYAFLGGSDPESHEEITASYTAAKERLLEYITALETK